MQSQNIIFHLTKITPESGLNAPYSTAYMSIQENYFKIQLRKVR